MNRAIELLAHVSSLIQGNSFISLYLIYVHWIAIAELPTILDSIFHGLVNTAGASMGVEGRGNGEP